MPNTQLKIDLPPSLYGALHTQAAYKGIDVADLCRSLIQQWVDKQRPAIQEDLLGDDGLPRLEDAMAFDGVSQMIPLEEFIWSHKTKPKNE